MNNKFYYSSKLSHILLSTFSHRKKLDSSSSEPQSSSPNSNPETIPQDQKLNLSYSTMSIISGTLSFSQTILTLFEAIIAGDLVATLPVPLEYAKIQMRVNPDLAQKGYWHTLKHTFTSEGSKGKYFLFSCENIQIHRFS